MRIAYLMQQYPVPTQTFAQSDIAALRGQGHEIAVFTMKPGAADCKGSLVFRPSLRGALAWPGALWRFSAALPGLLRQIGKAAARSPAAALASLLCLPRAAEIARAIERGNYDVVHLFWARHAALVLAMLARTRVPVVRSVFVGAYDLVADDFLVELASRHAQVLVSHAEVNRPFLQARAAPDTATAIIRRGIPLLQLAEKQPRDASLWVTASALVAEKNVDGVLKAFAHARAREPSLRLEIYGEGPDRSRLEHEADILHCGEAVNFAGHVERERLFDAMQRADACLLLSKKPSERLPNVVKEALWAGCEVISSNSEGIEELITDAGIGHVVDPDNARELEHAVEAVVGRDRALDKDRIARRRTFIASNFSADQSMRAYTTLWTRAAGAVDRAPAQAMAQVQPS